jgi:hypothetical protein
MNTAGIKSRLAIVAAALAFAGACSKKSEGTRNTAASSAQQAPAVTEPAAAHSPPEPAGSAAAAAGMSGTLVANPNPVPLCDRTGVGSTTVTWTTSGTNKIEIHIASPNGTLWTYGQAIGSAKTGEWVGKGTTFYLQNVKDNAPLTADHTLTRLTVDTVPGGRCP